jgi:hypothetical protein
MRAAHSAWAAKHKDFALLPTDEMAVGNLAPDPVMAGYFPILPAVVQRRDSLPAVCSGLQDNLAKELKK